jgi:gas vesicle protein
MSDINGTDKTAYITLGMMLGAAVGVVAGMMTAPKSGEEMRASVKSRALRAKDKAQDQLSSGRDKMTEKLSQTLEKSKGAVDTVADKAKVAVDKTAARAHDAADHAQARADGRDTITL